MPEKQTRARRTPPLPLTGGLWQSGGTGETEKRECNPHKYNNGARRARVQIPDGVSVCACLCVCVFFRRRDKSPSKINIYKGVKPKGNICLKFVLLARCCYCHQAGIHLSPSICVPRQHNAQSHRTDEFHSHAIIFFSPQTIIYIHEWVYVIQYYVCLSEFPLCGFDFC